jgi:hypothetical protein
VSIDAAPAPDLDALGEDQGIYVYGVVENLPDRVPSGLVGLDDAPVELVEHGDLAAAVGVIALDRPPGRRKDLLAHSTVLDTLAEQGPVVPIQFGSVMLHPDDIVEEVLAADVERLAGVLADLAGRRQFNVRARYNEVAVLAEVIAENPEIAHLRARTKDLPEDLGHAERVRLGELVARALERKRELDGAIITDAVLPLVVAHAPHTGGGVDHLLEIAVLVDEEQVPVLEDTLESLAEALHERVRLQLMGPLAPYDFVEAEAWD